MGWWPLQDAVAVECAKDRQRAFRQPAEGSEGWPLPANPAHGLNLPKVGTPAKRYLTHDEVRDLADAVDSLSKGMYRGERNNYGLVVKVLAYCGLPRGEPSGLSMDTPMRWGVG